MNNDNFGAAFHKQVWLCRISVPIFEIKRSPQLSFRNYGIKFSLIDSKQNGFLIQLLRESETGKYLRKHNVCKWFMLNGKPCSYTSTDSRNLLMFGNAS